MKLIELYMVLSYEYEKSEKWLKSPKFEDETALSHWKHLCTHLTIGIYPLDLKWFTAIGCPFNFAYGMQVLPL